MFAIGQCAGHFHRYWHRSEQPVQKKCLRIAAKRQCVGGTGRAHAYGAENRGQCCGKCRTGVRFMVTMAAAVVRDVTS